MASLLAHPPAPRSRVDCAPPGARSARPVGPVGPVAGRGASLRFTRRGRVVILGLLSVLLLVAFSVGRVSSRASGTDRPTGQPTVVVRAGDTLWSIARRCAPGSDPRRTVDHIVAANHLTSPTVRAGQRLVVPRG
ncbi:MAG: LysM peptidoglycan-binding domain-containing protein [Frankiaceae bacterium]